MEFQNETFNTISKKGAQFGGSFPVWSRVKELYQGGGTIDIEGMEAGTVIGAGTPVIFNGPGKEVTLLRGEAYDSTKAYAVGDVVIQANKIYQNKTAITEGETFTASKWNDMTAKVNGLTFEDVCIPDGCTLATCAVVRAGRIYADRVVGATIPSGIEANLPMIEFVRES